MPCTDRAMNSTKQLSPKAKTETREQHKIIQNWMLTLLFLFCQFCNRTRNMSNGCTFNQYQKRCSTSFYSVFILFVYSYHCYDELSNSVVLFLRNSSDPKGKCSVYAFIQSNDFLSYLYDAQGGCQECRYRKPQNETENETNRQRPTDNRLVGLVETIRPALGGPGYTKIDIDSHELGWLSENIDIVLSGTELDMATWN